MVKLMETKLPWTGPSPRAKVASGAVVEAEAALEDEVVAGEEEADLVAEAGEALEVRRMRGYFSIYSGHHVARALQNLSKLKKGSHI